MGWECGGNDIKFKWISSCNGVEYYENEVQMNWNSGENKVKMEWNLGGNRVKMSENGVEFR